MIMTRQLVAVCSCK